MELVASAVSFVVGIGLGYRIRWMKQRLRKDDAGKAGSHPREWDLRHSHAHYTTWFSSLLPDPEDYEAQDVVRLLKREARRTDELRDAREAFKKSFAGSTDPST